MKNNNDKETSKIRLFINKLLGVSSNSDNIQKNVNDRAKLEATARARREAEAKSKREAEILKERQGNQLHSNPDQGDILKILAKLNDLSDEFKILRNENEKKDKEIQRYREGYDASKVKDFFAKFTFVDSVIKEYLDENKIDMDGLNDIQIQMNEAFLEFGIETFSPEIGTEVHKSTDLIQENFKKIVTTNKKEHLTIAEVLRVGYRRKLPDSKFHIISKAKVRVFVFEE